MKITVYHPQNSQINGGYTVFSGPELRFSVDGNGHLKLSVWETSSERGEAWFAAGQWAYVCRSETK